MNEVEPLGPQVRLLRGFAERRDELLIFASHQGPNPNRPALTTWGQGKLMTFFTCFHQKCPCKTLFLKIAFILSVIRCVLLYLMQLHTMCLNCLQGSQTLCLCFEFFVLLKCLPHKSGPNEWVMNDKKNESNEWILFLRSSGTITHSLGSFQNIRSALEGFGLFYKTLDVRTPA